jgi:ATP-dependent Clp protease protease subunit
VRKFGGDRHLRDYLLTKRVVTFVGAVSENHFTEGIARMLFLLDKDPTTEIKIWLHSPGGHAVGGLGFYDLMRESSAPVSTHCLGRAGGIAALLLAAGAPNRRFVDPCSVVSLVDISLPGGRPYSTSLEMWDLHNVRTALTDLLAATSGQSHEAIREAMRDGTSFSAAAAISCGFADAFESDRALLTGLDVSP